MKARNQDVVLDLLLSVGNKVAEKIDGLFKRSGIECEVFAQDIETEDPVAYEYGDCYVTVYVGMTCIFLCGIKQGNGLLSERTVHVSLGSILDCSKDISMSNIDGIVTFAVDNITLASLVSG